MRDEAFYGFLDDNIAIESRPADYVNDPAVIAQNDNVVSVNSTIEMDLAGACNSEYVAGHQFTSTGGQLDFARGAYASKGGYRSSPSNLQSRVARSAKSCLASLARSQHLALMFIT
jgi:acyl-CoA hydrolase